MEVKLNLFLLHKIIDHGKCQIGIYGAGTITRQQSKVHDLAGYGKSCPQALFPVNQMMMHRRCRQERRNGSIILIHAPIAQYDVIAAFIHSFLRFETQALHPVFKSFRTISHGKCHGKFACVEPFVTQVAQQVKFLIGNDGTFQQYHLAQFRIRIHKIHVDRSYVAVETHHQFLSQWIDGRIGHLREMLAEIIV